MSHLSETYQELFEEVRRLHNRLRWIGDQLHHTAGQTMAKRSLLLSLHREGPCTVPDLARERLVSRQIIQTQINLLLEEGLVESTPNPRHKRSVLMALTPAGRKTVSGMLRRESDLLSRVGSPLSPEEAGETVDALRRLRGHLEKVEIG